MPNSDPQRQDTLAPGTMLGRYTIGRQLGRGGMGAVYEAVHRDLKKRVAIKVLSGPLAANEEAKQRFLREGEAASRIQHAHVVDVTDVGVQDGHTYLVMELLEGEDLASRLARAGVLSVGEVADILLPVCAGLAAAHDEGIVHRDLKPENIFLARKRQGGIEPKLLDFGVSKMTGPDALALTGTSASFGTPYYMPPEQVRGARQADQRSDVYALGVVLYECVTGRRPFQADNIYSMLHAIGAGDYPPPRSVHPALSPAVETVIVRAMRLDPAERYPSARAFGAALLAFAGQTARMVWAETFGAPPGAAASPVGGGFDQTVASVPSLPATSPPGSVTTLGTGTGQKLDVVRIGHRRRLGVVAGLSVAAVVGVVFAMIRSRDPAGPPQSPSVVAPASQPVAPPALYRVDVQTDPATAVLELDGVAVGSGHLRRDLPRDGRRHRLLARAPGHREAIVAFTDEAPEPRLVLAPVAAQAPPPPAPPPAARSTSSSQRQKASRKVLPSTAPNPTGPPPTRPGNRAPVLD